MSAFDYIEELVITFQRDVDLARAIESQNAEDDLAIKTAIVGFSHHSPIGDWAKSHHDFVKTRLEQDYSEDELAEYGDNSENVKLFFALCVGCLLGLYQRDKINGEEFQMAELQIPGLIMLHLGKLTAHPA